MSLSLHNLRYKIVAAAVAKGAVRHASRIPGVQEIAVHAADRLHPAGTAVSSYRGIAAGLLRDVLGAEAAGDALAYDTVAGLIPAESAEPLPDLELLKASAEESLSAGALVALAAACRASYVADFETSAEAYERAFAANPKDLRAVEGTLVSGARSHYDWSRIWTVARTLVPRRGPLQDGTTFWEVMDSLFMGASAAGNGAEHSGVIEPNAEQVQRAAAMIEPHAAQIRRLNQLLIETLAVRFQLLGAFRAGARLRQLMAQNRIDELRGIPLESALWLKHLLGAYAFLEDDRLHRAVARPPVASSDPQVARQVEKLRADVAFWDGDPAPLQDHAAARRREAESWGAERPCEWDMSELVAGRRVAVVGPASGGEASGELIDSYDVVVRTNLRKSLPQEERSRVGSRTDLSYYAALDLVRHWDDVAQLAAEGQLGLAVSRPHLLPAAQPLPDWLRIARFEFGLYFRGAPLGIQRILYDLLQFGPAEIGLFHADFYAGSRTAAPGYRDDALRFGPHSQANDPVVMHDLSFEFRLTQRLVRSGHLHPYGTAAEVLALSTEEYLTRLEERSPLRGALG